MRTKTTKTVTRVVHVEELHCEKTDEHLASFEDGGDGEFHTAGFELHPVLIVEADDGSLVRVRHPDREPIVLSAAEVIQFVGTARLETLFPSFSFVNGRAKRRVKGTGAAMGVPITKNVGPELPGKGVR